MSTPQNPAARRRWPMILLVLAVVTAVAVTAAVYLSGRPVAVAGTEVKGTAAVLDLPMDTPALDVAADASQRLAWEVVQRSDDANRLTSPSSLAMNLAMAGEGAVGPSAESIDRALGLSGDERSAAFGALRQSLRAYESLPTKVSADDPPETPVVHQAGRVLVIDWTVEQAFLDRLSRFYDAPATEVQPGEAQASLDAWVRRNTANLIEKSGIKVTSRTKVVLQDAVLFAAAWETPFKDEGTMAFQTPRGPEQVDSVSGQLPLRYAEGDRWSAVRLAYDENLSADVILPKQGVAPQDLTADELAEAAKALGAAEHGSNQVTMPRFDLKQKTDLLQALPDVDLGTLDGIFPTARAEQWVQQVRLEVSAKGTVGAAVTEMGIEAGSAPGGDEPFVVDRPYVFRVLDTRTDWALFLAVIADPAAKDD